MGTSAWPGHPGVVMDLLALQARLRREPATWHPARADGSMPPSVPWPGPGEVPALQRRIGRRPAPGELPELQRRIGRRAAGI